jgi:hypothetical protein
MIDFSKLEDAFFFVNSGQQYMQSAIINKNTGETFYQSDLTGIDEFPDDSDSEDYIEIPHKDDLDLGSDMVFEFVAIHLPEKVDEVEILFSSRDAYSQFKTLLESMDLLDQWYQYEEEQTQMALRQWCEDSGLEIAE